MSRLDTLKESHKRKMTNNGMCFLRCPETAEDTKPYKIHAYSCDDCGFSYVNHKFFERIIEDTSTPPL